MYITTLEGIGKMNYHWLLLDYKERKMSLVRRSLVKNIFLTRKTMMEKVTKRRHHSCIIINRDPNEDCITQKKRKSLPTGRIEALSHVHLMST